MLTKTATTLKLETADDTLVVFNTLHDPQMTAEGEARSVIFPTEVWEKMGKPEDITITIEPGKIVGDESKE